MEDIINEINFNKFDSFQNTKIDEKLNKLLQRKWKMDKLVEKNMGNNYDKNSKNILLDNMDSSIKDHITIYSKVESDVDNNFDYMKKIKNISELFDKISEPIDEEKKGTLI